MDPTGLLERIVADIQAESNEWQRDREFTKDMCYAPVDGLERAVEIINKYINKECEKPAGDASPKIPIYADALNRMIDELEPYDFLYVPPSYDVLEKFKRLYDANICHEHELVAWADGSLASMERILWSFRRMLWLLVVARTVLQPLNPNTAQTTSELQDAFNGMDKCLGNLQNALGHMKEEGRES